jgi:transglutaminase-like putative cysteine protease
MKSESKKPDQFGQLALFLGFFLTVLFIVQCYAAFGHGRADLLRPVVAILITAAGCLVSWRLSLMLPGERTNNRRALIGTAMMVLVLYALIGFAQFTSLRDRLQPWEFLILPICTFTFFLNSQLSFLILSITEGSIILWSLKDPPSFILAVVVVMAYTLGLMLLFAILHIRERLTRVPEAPAIDREIPLRIGPVAGLLLLDLFGLFLVVKPPEPESAVPAPAHPSASDSTVAPAEEPFLNFGRRGLESTSVGFDYDLKFGDLQSGAEDKETIMMVQLLWGTPRSLHPDELDFPLMWKMASLGDYDGVRWKPFEGPETVLQAKNGVIELNSRWPRSKTYTIRQRILLSPMKQRALFMLYPPWSIDLDTVCVDAEGTVLRHSTSEGPFKYEAYSVVPPRLRERLEVAQAKHPDSRYLYVPPELKKDAGFQAFVARLQNLPTHIDAVQRAVEILAGYRYTRKPGLIPGRDPTSEFLRVRRGYCQHFASTMALALRQVNIPARIAIGFSGGDWNEALNAIVVRRQHAHAWVEVYFEDLGWLPFDPVLEVTSRSTSKAPEPKPKETPKAPDPPPESQSKDLGQKPSEELRKGNDPAERPVIDKLPDPSNPTYS